ncbi:MAG: hypothetical protein V5A38_06280 [Halolamina sp.]|uniref:hypothetical protein n=1 Tax=Halolamina sp. TaxID=1940283 RepID=UPI002FC338C5
MGTRDTVDTLLFGRDTRLSTRLVWVAAALFVVSLFVHLPVRYLPVLSLTGYAVTWVLFLSMFLVAAGAAYLNDGLFVAVALAAGIGIGFYAPGIIFHLGDPGEVTLWVLAVGTISSVGIGVVGFFVGAGARRLFAE